MRGGGQLDEPVLLGDRHQEGAGEVARDLRIDKEAMDRARRRSRRAHEGRQRFRRDVEPRRTADPPRTGAVVADDEVARARHGIDHREAPPAAAGHRPGPGGPAAALVRLPAAAGESAGLGGRGSVGLEEQQRPAAVEQNRRPDAEHAPGGGLVDEIGAVGRGHAGTRARRER